MKQRTIEILKNFASINSGLIFKKGNRLRTISMASNIFAVADVPDEFPVDFAIYDLNELLTTISLFDNPEIVYENNHLVIKSGRTQIKYVYSQPSVVVAPPDSDVNLVGELFTFRLSQNDYARIRKASGVLKLKDLLLSPDKLVCYDVGVAGNEVVIEVDAETVTGEKSATIKLENLKMIDGDYDVSVFEKAVRFTNVASPDIVYHVAVETVQ